MPRYRFTGFFETVLHGLAHGVNAELHRADDDGEPVEHEQPPGSTVVVQPGDEVETDLPYPHAHLVNLDTGEPDQPPADPADVSAATDLATINDGDAFVAGVPAPPGDTTPAAIVGQHAAETSEPPAGEQAETVASAAADPDNPPAASSATDESQE